MRVGTVELHDFRSYASTTVGFQPGINVLVGPNGVGKTNVVEAVGYVATLGSHRVATDLPLVRSGAAHAVIRVQSLRGGRTVSGDVMIVPGRANQLRISGSPVRPRDFLGLVRTVVFAPEDLALVRGDPSERRKWLDDVLTQRAPRYAGVRSDYERVVKQRNALLKSLAGGRRQSHPGDALTTLQIWDEQLASNGAALLFGRISLLAEIDWLVAQAYASVAVGAQASIAYDPRSLAAAQGQELPRDRQALQDLLSQEIAARRNDEIARGVTLVGPHRDDISITIGGLAARNYASHGECWSMALSLRLAAFELLRGLDDGVGDPVLILDDVFAELDDARRAAIATVATGAEQVLVTAAVGTDIPDEFNGVRFNVAAGEVIRVAG
ncbi:MAG: DNA replication/repair protein RecF [Actinomycetes bacterium]